MTREEVVQAALTVERWCEKTINEHDDCDCPFYKKEGIGYGRCILWQGRPIVWELEEYLRTRGLKHD